MVKLQKSLTKPVDIIEKKKKKVPTPPLAGISKVGKKVKPKDSIGNLPKPKKEKLVETIIKDVEVVAPVKKGKKDKLKTDVKKTSTKTKEKSKVLKQKGEKNNKTQKRPLVLAPPENYGALLQEKTQHRNKSKLQKKKEKKIKPTAGEQTTPLSNLQKKKAAKRAFRKQQLKKRRENKINKTKKHQPKRLFKAPPFDEDKFKAIVNEDNIKIIAKGLKKQVEKEVSEKKTAIFSDFQYCLNVACFKIPNAPKRIVKLNLKHSLVDKGDDVAIIVSDLQRGAKVDYEPTIQHYEEIFREAGIEGLTIIPFNKLRNECTTFETVRKFGNTYDYFLCDGRLVGHASGFCGKVFQKPRTTFHSVRMVNLKNLKREIEKSLHRTAYKQLQKGDLISIPVGNHKFTEDQLAENIMYVLEQLKNTYPGGFPNIRGLYLRISIAGTSSLPIYLSVAEAPADTPYVVGPREDRLLKMKREANEVLSHFNMTKEGKLLKLSKTDVKRKQKLKEMRADLEAENNVTEQNRADKTNGKQSVVPAKKAKTEKSVSTTNKTDKEKAKDEKPTVEEHDDDEDSEAEQDDEGEQDSGEDDADEDNSGEEDDSEDDGEDEEGDGDEDDSEDDGDDEEGDEEGAGDGDDDDDDEDEETPSDNEDDSE